MAREILVSSTIMAGENRVGGNPWSNPQTSTFSYLSYRIYTNYVPMCCFCNVFGHKNESSIMFLYTLEKITDKIYNKVNSLVYIYACVVFLRCIGDIIAEESVKT